MKSLIVLSHYSVKESYVSENLQNESHGVFSGAWLTAECDARHSAQSPEHLAQAAHLISLGEDLCVAHLLGRPRSGSTVHLCACYSKGASRSAAIEYIRGRFESLICVWELREHNLLKASSSMAMTRSQLKLILRRFYYDYIGVVYQWRRIFIYWRISHSFQELLYPFYYLFAFYWFLKRAMCAAKFFNVVH
jgi:hypothetical protein